jgi:hypothetical protein
MQGCLKLVLLMKFSSTRKKKKRSTSVRFSEENYSPSPAELFPNSFLFLISSMGWMKKIVDQTRSSTMVAHMRAYSHGPHEIWRRMKRDIRRIVHLIATFGSHMYSASVLFDAI